MRKSYSLLLVLLMCLSINAQKTYFTCDFNYGIPEGFALYDVDGNTPTAAMQKEGFEVGKPWISMSVLTDRKNLSIGSTSAYTPAGTANDWIVLPAITLESEYAYFKWTAANLTSSALKKDGYKILISTKGNTVDDFNDANVLYETTKGEQQPGALYTHLASLKEYAGQTIYIAVVNNSTNKSILIMDDFWVGEIFENLELKNTTNNVLDKDVTSRVTCSLVNPNFIDFKENVTVTLDVDGETYSKDLGLVNLAYGGVKKITFSEVDVPAPLEGESRNYTLTATYSTPSQGNVVQTINSALHRLGSTYSRKVVAEEATGTWCGYCPRGAVGMKAMREKYPDDFIGIAVHNDIMQVNEYMAGISSFITGFPSAVVNRTIVIDPTATNLEKQHIKELAKPSVASLNIVKADFGPDNVDVRVTVASSFAFNTDRGNSNFRLAFVVIENEVSGTSDDYDQTNYYSGGGTAMGGFEKLPDPVPASQMVYQEVARGIVSSFVGVKNSIPQNIVKDEEFISEYIFRVPETVMNKKNIEIIAMLVDQSSGAIWNADKIEAGDIGYDPNVSGVESGKKEQEQIKLYVENDNLCVLLNMESINPTRVELFSLDGKKVKDVRADSSLGGIFVPINELKGIYVVKVSSGNSTLVRKVAL